MKKNLVLLGFLTLCGIFTSCDKKQTNLKSLSVHNSGDKLFGRPENGTYEFKSGLGLGAESHFEMDVTVDGEVITVMREEVSGGNVEFSTYGFVGYESIDESEENNTLVRLNENSTYCFVPFNTNNEPVFIVRGASAVRFWCTCHNEATGTLGFCLTSVVQTNNTATVKCNSLECTWCELKYGGIADPHYEVPDLGELGYGTIIETDHLTINGVEYRAE